MRHKEIHIFGAYQEVYVPDDVCDAAMLKLVADEHMRNTPGYEHPVDSKRPLFWYAEPIPGTHLIEVEFHDGLHEPIKAWAFIVHEDAGRPYLAWKAGIRPVLRFSEQP